MIVPLPRPTDHSPSFTPQPQHPTSRLGIARSHPCEVDITSRTIWIVALRDITDGEELTYNYGYEYEPDSYHDFPCHCGATQCYGFILAREYWGMIPPTARSARG